MSETTQCAIQEVNLHSLAEPFPAEEVEFRVGQAGGGDSPWAKVLAYIDARAVMDRLDEVVGPGNWKDRYWELKTTEGHLAFMCALAIRVNGEWVEKVDGSEETDVEAFKGGISKALVRAAVHWGIGRYLYRLGDGWANIVPKGTKGAKYQPKGQKANEFYWIPPTLPEWALPKASKPEKAPAEPVAAPSVASKASSRTQTTQNAIKQRIGNGQGQATKENTGVTIKAAQTNGTSALAVVQDIFPEQPEPEHIEPGTPASNKLGGTNGERPANIKEKIGNDLFPGNEPNGRPNEMAGALGIANNDKRGNNKAGFKPVAALPNASSERQADHSGNVGSGAQSTKQASDPSAKQPIKGDGRAFGVGSQRDSSSASTGSSGAQPGAGDRLGVSGNSGNSGENKQNNDGIEKQKKATPNTPEEIEWFFNYIIDSLDSVSSITELSRLWTTQATTIASLPADKKALVIAHKDEIKKRFV